MYRFERAQGLQMMIFIHNLNSPTLNESVFKPSPVHISF